MSLFQNRDYIPYINALAVDSTISVENENIPQEIDILDLNNTDQIIDWILKNAKEV